MRKWITILGAIGLAATTTTSVLACTNNQKSTNPLDPGDGAKTLVNEKLVVNDDDSITINLFYANGDEVVVSVLASDALNPTIKELKTRMDVLNQSLNANNDELTTTMAGLPSFKQNLLKNIETIAKAEVFFSSVETKYQAIAKIYNGTNQNSEEYTQVARIFAAVTTELNQAQTQLTYAKNIYQMNLENQAAWADKITWLEDNVATLRSEKLTQETNLLTILQTAGLI